MSVIERARRRATVATFVMACVLFVSAGTLAWLAGWLYVAALAAGTLSSLAGPYQVDEGLVAERMQRPVGAKPWDRLFLGAIALLTPVELIVAGLDRRFAWTRPLPPWSMWVGFAGVVAGSAGLSWAMHTNRFFSAVVRIQSDRGHHVVASGPYRFVRHPGYAAWIVAGVSLPWLLGSFWLYVPVGLLTLMFVVRTAVEDRVLTSELPGYVAYRARVGSKLIPGIW